MSRPIHDRLRKLETDVQDLRVMPAADVRARGRRRGRRRLAVTVAAVAVVATTGGIAATKTLDWPHQRAGGTAPVAAQPTTDRTATCKLALPNSLAAVRVRVLDGGASAGLADSIATDLRKRRLTVLSDAPGPGDPDAVGPATLRYGPAAIGTATVLRALLSDDATMRFDPDRDDDIIDLTLGATFSRLSTPTETNQALAAVGEPTAPPGCSPGASPSPSR